MEFKRKTIIIDGVEHKTQDSHNGRVEFLRSMVVGQRIQSKEGANRWTAAIYQMNNRKKQKIKLKFKVCTLEDNTVIVERTG